MAMKSRKTVPSIQDIRRRLWMRCVSAKKRGTIVIPVDVYQLFPKPWDTEAWKGHCGDLARTVSAMMGGCGCTVEGKYYGPIALDSFFDRDFRSNADVARSSKKRPNFYIHSWIEDRGFIIDPTRWVFEAAEPYVFVADRFSKAHEHYVRIDGKASAKKKWPDAMTGLTDEFALHVVSKAELKREAVRCQKWREAQILNWPQSVGRSN